MNLRHLAWMCLSAALALSSALTFAQNKKSTPSSDGYEIRKTKKGFVKVPKSKAFQLGATEIEGEGTRPAPLTFENNPNSRRRSLIPLKENFQTERLSAGSVWPQGSLTRTKK